MKSITNLFWCVALSLLSANSLVTCPAVAQGQQPVVLSVERFMLGGVRHAWQTDSLSAIQGLPSPSKAVSLSLASTMLPIVAGFVVWAAQKPEHIVEHYDGNATWEYDKDPDRTLPLVLIATGVMFGPSVGYVYGDCGNRGGAGILIRGIVGTATITTAYTVANSIHSDGFMDFSGAIAGLTIGVVGGAVIVVDAIYDLSKVEQHIRAQNDKKLGTTLGLAPGIYPYSGTPTLNLHVTF